MDDLRFAIRRLATRPWVTFTATITIALAIGANTAILSVADAVLFRPLPYEDPDRLFIVQMQQLKTRGFFMSVPLSLFDAIGGASGIRQATRYESGPTLTIAATDGVAALRSVRVVDNYFSTLGISAERGRLFQEGEARTASAARSLVLTHSTFRRYFAADEAAIGRAVSLGGTSYDVIGVLPAGFVFPAAIARPDVILLSTEPAANGNTFSPVVRIASGRTREQLQAELDSIAANLPELRKDVRPVLFDVRSVLFPVGRPMMTFLLLAAAAVLVIGCINVSSMLSVGAKVRERETGISLALGVSRARLIRQSLLEGMLIGLAGTLLAVATTRLAFELLIDHVPPAAYGAARVGVDARVTLISLAAGMLSALFFSAIPTWHASRGDAVTLLRGTVDARRIRRFGHPAIAVQVAAALVLGFGGIIASKTFIALLNVPLGFEPERVVTIRVRPPDLKGRALRDFYVRALDRIRAVPSVASAGAITGAGVPLSGAAATSPLFRGGERLRSAGVEFVLPGYFETVGISLVRGRFPSSDDILRGVAVMSETGARAVLDPQQDPIGQFVELEGGTLVRIIGIVSDVRYGIGSEAGPSAYVTMNDVVQATAIMVKAHSHDPEVLRELHRVAAAMAPTAPVDVAWWTTSINSMNRFLTPRFQTLVLGSFATLSLILTAVGVYGLVSFLGAQRKREIGVRLAIGARPQSIAHQFVGQMIAPVIIGIIGGGLAIWWLTGIARSQLSGLQPNDPGAALMAVTTVLTSAVIAAYLPARRASRLDPVTALRQE